MSEVQALICSPSDHNRTILLSSHILREFEKVFDIVTIIAYGKLNQIQGGMCICPSRGTGLGVCGSDSALDCKTARQRHFTFSSGRQTGTGKRKRLAEGG